MQKQKKYTNLENTSGMQRKKKQTKQHHHLKPLVYISLWKPKSSSNIYSLLPRVHFVSLFTGSKKVGGMGWDFFNSWNIFPQTPSHPSSLYLLFFTLEHPS